MTEIPKPSHLGRLHILTQEELQDLYELPNFTDQERHLYFSLTKNEFELLAEFRSMASKLNFILQLGYFKARHLFFNFEFQAVSTDMEFIRRVYFPKEKKRIRKLEKVAINTVLKHRRTIAELFNYQFCGRPQRKLIEQTAQNSARISSKPIYIFREILTFLQNHRIILPGYSFLQDVISKSLNNEEDRLRTLLRTRLTSTETEKLKDLLTDSVGFYEITNLKREPRDFSFSEIKREIERGAKIKEIYQSAKEILPIL